jgi:type IV pilus assembly protein PilF
MMMSRSPLDLLGAALLAAALVTGCASKSPPPNAPPPQESLPPIKQPVVTPEYRSQLRAELGAGYFERGQMDVALEELNEAVRLDPNNARAWNIYGLVYAVLGENPKAEQSFQRALQLAPQDSDTRHNWGWYLCTHGRASESIAEFEAALRNPLYKTPETALVNAGKCSASLGRIADAETYFRRALQVAPSNATAAYNLALIAFKTSRLDEARVWMKIVAQETSPPPESLYLGMCIERKLGDTQAERSYVSQLRNRYPNAAETKSIATGACE